MAAIPPPSRPANKRAAPAQGCAALSAVSSATMRCSALKERPASPMPAPAISPWRSPRIDAADVRRAGDQGASRSGRSSASRARYAGVVETVPGSRARASITWWSASRRMPAGRRSTYLAGARTASPTCSLAAASAAVGLGWSRTGSPSATCRSRRRLVSYYAALARPRRERMALRRPAAGRRPRQ